MSDLGNKEIMAKNLKKYLALKGITAARICDDLGFKHNTFSDWVNARTYPRIDKIEMMANYFGCSKADLVEEYKPQTDYVIDAGRMEIYMERMDSRALKRIEAYARYLLARMKEKENED